jgi:hypothetical protein
VVMEGCTYLGWLRGILIAGLEPVMPRAGCAVAGLAKCAALEKCGIATGPPPLPGGFARAAWVKVIHVVAKSAAQTDVFI